jgi:hypothetical protein
VPVWFVASILSTFTSQHSALASVSILHLIPAIVGKTSIRYHAGHADHSFAPSKHLFFASANSDSVRQPSRCNFDSRSNQSISPLPPLLLRAALWVPSSRAASAA